MSRFATHAGQMRVALLHCDSFCDLCTIVAARDAMVCTSGSAVASASRRYADVRVAARQWRAVAWHVSPLEMESAGGTLCGACRTALVLFSKILVQIFLRIPVIIIFIIELDEIFSALSAFICVAEFR